MRITTPKYVIEWNGSHGALVTDSRGEVDAFTFAWYNSNPTAIDFVDATIFWLKED